MKKIIQLAKNRRKSKSEAEQHGIRQEPEKERRKSTFSFLSEISSEFNFSRTDLEQNHSDVGDKTVGGYTVDLNSSSDISFTKLHKACWLGNFEKVKKHSRKNDVNLQDNENRSCLHYAAVSGNADIIEYLYECNASFNLRDSDGRTPYLKVVECKHQHLIKLLLDCGSDVNISDSNENSACHVAVETNEIDILKAVLQYGGNPDHQNKHGSTSLHLACSDEINPAVVYLLLLHGAAVNTLDKNMRTCLMLACKTGCMDVVKVLLDNQANISNKDDRGLTAEDYAVMGGYHDIAGLLSLDNNEEIGENEDEQVEHSIQLNDSEDDTFDQHAGCSGMHQVGQDVEINSWNDSSDEFSEAKNHEEIKITIPSLNLSDLIPLSSDCDEENKESDSSSHCSEGVENKKQKKDVDIDEKNMEKVPVNSNLDNHQSPSSSPHLSPGNKRKMSIILGLVDDDDDFDSPASISSNGNSEVNFTDDGLNIYVPTLVENSIASPTQSDKTAVQDTGSLLNLPEDSSKTRLYKKHTRSGSNISIASHASGKAPSIPKIENVSQAPVLTDSESDWDSEEDDAEMTKSDSNENFSNKLESSGTKDGTLGRFGTLAGVDEIWENNPLITKPKNTDEVDSRIQSKPEDSLPIIKDNDRNSVISDATSDLQIVKDDKQASNETANSNELLVQPQNVERFGPRNSIEVAAHRTISTITCDEMKNDVKVETSEISEGSDKLSIDLNRRESFLEIPSKLTFRRKSLEPEQASPVPLNTKRSHFKKASSMDVVDTQEYGLMRKISLTVDSTGGHSLGESLQPSKDIGMRSLSPESEATTGTKQPKRRFSLAGSLKSRRKSIADWEKQNESLDLIPEDDCNEGDTQKKYGNRKQFRCFKVSPGESNKDVPRRASIAIGESKPAAISSKMVMQTISRRLSLSSPDSDANIIASPVASPVASPEPPASSPDIKETNHEIQVKELPCKLEKICSPERKPENLKPENISSPERKPECDIKSMYLEDITSPTLSDSEMLDQQGSDRETDYNDQTDNLSISSSEDEVSEENILKFHQVTSDSVNEDMLRELRIALEKELAHKKTLQNRVKQLQRDRVKYMRKIDSYSSHVNSLNQSLLETESQYKYLEFQITEEVGKKDNLKLLLDKVKEQLATKEQQYMNEIKSKEDALQKIKFLEEDLKSSKFNARKMSKFHEDMDGIKSAENARKAELETKLASLEENLESYERRMQMLEADKLEMKTSNDILVSENLNIKDEFDKEKMNWVRIHEELLNSKEEVLKENEECQQQKLLVEKALDKACLDYMAKLNESAIEYARCREELKQANVLVNDLRVENNKLQSQIDQGPHEDELKKSLEKQQKTQIKSLEDELCNLRDMNNLLKSRLQVLETSFSERSHEDANHLVDTLNEKIDGIKLSLDGVKEETERSNIELQRKFEQSNMDNSLQNEWSSMLTQLQKEHGSMQAKLTNRCSLLENKVKSLEMQLEESECQKTNVEQSLKKKDSRLTEIQQDLNNIKKESESFEMERTYLNKDLQKSELKIKSLEESVEELRESEFKLQEKYQRVKLDLKGAEKLAQQGSSTKDDEKMKIKQLEMENEQLKEKIHSLESQICQLQLDVSAATTGKDHGNKLVADLKCQVISLESCLEEEKTRHAHYKSEASSHQNLWEAELKSKSMLGLRLSEYEQRCRQYDEDLKRERETLVKLEIEKRDLIEKLQAEKISSQKLKENLVLLKTHLKIAKKRIKKLESEPAEAHVKILKDQMQEEKSLSEGLVKKLERHIKHQDMQIKHLEQQISHLETEICLMEEQLQERELQLKRLDYRIKSRAESQKSPIVINKGLVKAQSLPLEEKSLTLEAERDSSEEQVTQLALNRLVDPCLESYKRLISEKAQKEINEQLGRINSHLEEQAKSQLIIDSMRADNESKLKEELNCTRNAMSEELSKMKTALDEKMEELRNAHRENTRLKNDGVPAEMSMNNDSYNVPRHHTFHGPMLSTSAVPSTLSFQESPSKRIPSSVTHDDGFSHLLQRQLERTIQHHLNSEPEVTLDIPDRDLNSVLHSRSNSSHSQDGYVSALKQRYFV